MKKVFAIVLVFTGLVLYADDPDLWPVVDTDKDYITSEFGYREDGFGGRAGFHTAIDIKAYKGSMVVSTMSGEVKVHFPPPDGYWKGHPIYGGCILIVGEDGWATFYAHLSRSYVMEGDMVTKGQMIGRVGNTGLSTGNHLHYEILIDPERFIKE